MSDIEAEDMVVDKAYNGLPGLGTIYDNFNSGHLNNINKAFVLKACKIALSKKK